MPDDKQVLTVKNNVKRIRRNHKKTKNTEKKVKPPCYVEVRHGKFILSFH